MNNITSIMLVTYNRLALTKRMFDSFFNTASGHPHRLIVVDNGSTDGTVEYLKDLKNNCNTFWELQLNDQNLGIASGRNQCLKLASKYGDKYLCTLDNDVELPNDWLKESVNFLESNPDWMIGVNFEDVKYPIININGHEIQHKISGNLGSACMVFNKALHHKIGYFTSEYENYGHEDANWGFRARLCGYQLGYIKDSGIHIGSGVQDVGEYREFKNEYAAKNLPKFHQDCRDYSSRKKSIYIPYSIKQ